MFLKKVIIATVIILSFSTISIAQTMQTHDSTSAKSQQLQLPENVHAVLIHEMTTITHLMGNLLEFIVRGDAINSSRAALEISNTNLKQEFNLQELKKIMKILPKGFIKMDQKFHMTANAVANAVDTNDFKTAINLYSEMTQSCVSCHMTYANNRFKNLKIKRKSK